ncbi:MAG: peptidoglycan DD-metalloendopeptidase family protein, partial [Bacteroidetes bacterium]|nr:peptidoglycan DD-metalloendopeptidase family protein [Bacteroidota bacterium]
MRLYLCMCVFAFPLGVFAQNVSEQTKRRQEIEREIAVIDRQIASNQAAQKNTLQVLALLQQKIDARKNLLADMDVQMSQLEISIRKKQDEIAALQEEYDDMEEAYIRLLYKAYVHRNRQVWVAYIFGSQNFRQAYRRWRYFKSYAESINRQAFQIKQVRLKVEEEIKESIGLQAEAEALHGVRQQELVSLTTEERESRQLITNMSQQESQLRKQLQQKQNEVTQLNKEIERILSQAEKERQTATVREQEIDRTLAADFEQNRGKLPWPLRQGGVVDEPYGQRDHPVLKGIKSPFNRGIGIAGAQNDEVLAVFQGVVKQVVVIPGYNQCVLVQHGSYYTFYCKLGFVQVKSGDRVNVGTVLGTLAERSFHFELAKGG